MIGDAPDFARRLSAQLPAGWFDAAAPRIGGVLAGFSQAWASLYAALIAAQLQLRLATVSGGFLDMACADYTGRKIVRRKLETDDVLRWRLLPVFRDKVTRAALISRLTALTGNVPTIFEPARPGDTGGYNIARGYNVAGAYGTLTMPFQFFVTVQRPVGQGLATVSGYNTFGGGWGVGALVYARIEDSLPHVTDQDINDAIVDTLPVSSIAWTLLTGASAPS